MGTYRSLELTLLLHAFTPNSLFVLFERFGGYSERLKRLSVCAV
jgi:hypothetical protein